jgi:hypothetical protein
MPRIVYVYLLREKRDPDLVVVQIVHRNVYDRVHTVVPF